MQVSHNIQELADVIESIMTPCEDTGKPEKFNAMDIKYILDAIRTLQKELKRQGNDRKKAFKVIRSLKGL